VIFAQKIDHVDNDSAVDGVQICTTINEVDEGMKKNHHPIKIKNNNIAKMLKSILRIAATISPLD